MVTGQGAGRRGQRQREMVLARKNKPVTCSSPVFQVSEEIRVNHQVFVHCEIFIEFLPGSLPEDRNGESQDKHLHLITAGKDQP